MAHELKGWARSRPLRVAFLIEDGEYANLALDGVFADCYGRWGGRFSLIVPCFNRRILEQYWIWLEAYDPDIVYSYVPLDKARVMEIHDRISPSKYAFHKLGCEPRLDIFGFKPTYDFSPLSSLSTIFKLSRYSPRSGDGPPIRIIDSWHTEKPTRFLTDNFGTYGYSQASSIYPLDATTAASLLTIVSPDIQADRRYGVPGDLNIIPDEMAALREFAAKRVTSLSIASALFAPKLNIQSGPWSSSFNLVIGDSFADRILFWNGRLMIPEWLDADLCCLRIGFDQLKEPEFLAALGDLLRSRNHVTDGSGGRSQITIRSVSLNADQLAEARQLVLSTKSWSIVTAEVVSEISGIVPEADAIKSAREGGRFGGALFHQPDWTRFMWSPPIAHPPVTVPDHLSDAPMRQMFTIGSWCADFIFEHDGQGSHITTENRWMLPRRWRMAGAFKLSLAGGSQRFVAPAARRSRDGNLTIFVSTTTPVEAITIPTAYEAMQYALAADGVWLDDDLEYQQARPPSKVAWVHPSNEARYLTGVFGLAGGLRRAKQFFLHPFLRENFSKLGGTPGLPRIQVMPTLSRLQKKFQGQETFDLRGSGEREALADLIVKASRDIKNPKEFLGYDKLKEEWKVYRIAFWARHPQPNVDTSIDWDKREEGSLDACLIELRHRQLIYQGHLWTCRKCHHRNWVDFSKLSSEFSCEVCKQTEQAPVRIQWVFRPNEFLIESLRSHSVLSLIWVLSVLGDRSRRSFIFVEPTWFGYASESEKKDAEADLLVILDGQAILCEVKSSWHSLRLTDISDFVALAIRLRPDTALLAVMEVGAGPETDLLAAKNRLAEEGIRLELLTPNASENWDDPYLYFDDID